MEILSFLQILLFSSLSCIILLLFTRIKSVLFGSKNKKITPPSPPKLPIIGNLHQLGSNPNQNLHKLSKKYGPLMLLHLGSVPTLVASSAEAAKEILHTHDLSFCSRPNPTMAKVLLYDNKGISFSPYGEYWRRAKSIMVQKLLSSTRVKLYQKVRENEIDNMIQMLGDSCGNTVDMISMFVSMTNNIICEVTVGRKFDRLQDTNLVKRFVDMFGVFIVGSYFPWLSWVDQITGAIKRAKKVGKEFDEFLEGVIEEHVNKKKEENGISDKKEDFVDLLLDLQRSNTSEFTLHKDSLKVLVLEAFLAGIDTTFTSLEWITSELIRNTRVMKKLQHEVAEVARGKSKILEEDLEKMPYLKAVLKETFRLHPPVPFLIPRKAMHDLKLMGYDVAEGTEAIVNVWAIGRDPNLWEEPNEFRPERFLNNSINYQALQFHLLPFGAGRRSCPGVQFSVPVIELALANIVYKFDIAPPNGIRNEDLDMTEAFGITVHRKSSLLVSVSPRF